MATLLVLEDDPVQREMMDWLLTDAGHIVFMPEPEEAVEAYREHEPDWVVLDLRMPYPGGLAVLYEFERAGIKPRVIIWTAYLSTKGAGEVLDKTRRLGVEAYIEKDGLGGNLLRWLARQG